MTQKEKIARAKTRLVLKHPYFGLLASRLRVEPSQEVEAFSSDGRVLRYNPGFFAAEPVESIEFALANSVMHHVLAHENRRMGRHGWLWQLATDYAINGMLMENGFRLPKPVHCDPRFEGKYAEEIYAILKEEIGNGDCSDDERGEEGSGGENADRIEKIQYPDKTHRAKGSSHFLPPGELEPETEAMWEMAMREAMERAMKQGYIPGGLERLFVGGVESTVDWRSELHQAINRYIKNDYTFAKPNKKMIAESIYLPSTTSDCLTVAVAIDSSGSVDEELLGLFISELEALMLSFSGVEVDLLVCDSKIQGVYRFLSGEILDFVPKGGGGTDFRPVFDYIEKELPHISLLIYFTDMQGTFPDEVPMYETIWVVPQKRDIPFGRMIVLPGRE